MSFVPTPEQEKVLDHEIHSHARLLAGPGTGKSATIVALIDKILSREPPPRVRLLTFTRAATGELAKKVSSHPAAASLRPSTIHSFAISVVRANPGAVFIPSPLRIADKWEADNIVRVTLARRLGLGSRTLATMIAAMAADWQSLTDGGERLGTPAERAHFMGGWEEHRRVFGYTLLDELPFALLQALRSHSDLIGVDHDVLIVDEFQDLNACDLEVLKLISERGAALIAVGDDDQSIYSFRCAAPEGIRSFLVNYPGAKDYPLSVTQRCGAKIIDWASAVIEGDPGRPVGRPRLIPVAGSPPGEVALLAFATEKKEAEGIARIIAKLTDPSGRNIPAGEILILLRTDYNGVFSNPIKLALEAVGVKCAQPDYIERILAMPENRRLLEMLRLLVDRSDSLAWASLLTLQAGIGQTFVDRIYSTAKTSGQPFGATLLAEYEGGLPSAPAASRSRADQLIKKTLQWLDAHPLPGEEPETGWGEWILSIVPGDTFVPALGEEFRQVLSEIDCRVESDIDLGRYLAQLGPLGKDIAQSQSDGVRIMTMQSSKGLTVRATIVAGLESELIPRPNADIAEERRLLYVAMTRAREVLIGTWARRRRGPTARAGLPRVVGPRSPSSLLSGARVSSQDGESFLRTL